MRLTAKERILLHLLDYVKFAEAIEVPRSITQDGLARAVGVDLRHLTQYLRPLVREGLVRERVAHVRGIRQRRRVYGLSESGQIEGYRLRDRVKAGAVRVQDEAALRETTFGALAEELAGKASLVDLVRLSMVSETLDLEALLAPAAAAVVARISDAPRVERFVGRRAELEAITREDSRARIFVVRGVAGIGKSSLGAKACEVFRGRWNLLWHAVRPWDTHASILARLGEFLSELGKPGLRAILARGDLDRAMQVLREDLQGTRALLVLDDAHEASPEVVAFLRFLKDAIGAAPHARVLVLTRRSIPFYDRRDVAIRNLVREIELGGLRAEDLAALGSADREAIPPDLVRRLGGHPLFLELVRTAPHPGMRKDVLRNVSRFIEEEIYTTLSEAERQTLKVASLYRVPVPREALLAHAGASHDVVLSLTNRALLQTTGEEGFEVHDTIRDFFAGILAPAEREDLGAFAAGQLRSLADDASKAGRPVEAIRYLSNALGLGVPASEQAPLWETLGDMSERIGDLPAALTSYKESAKRSKDPEVRSRLHRKTAAALEVRGELHAASREVDAGIRALGGRDSVERGRLGLVVASIAAGREDWDAALAAGDSALATFRAFGDSIGQARALLELGNVDILAAGGDPARAERRLQDALRIPATSDEPELFAGLHTALAHLYGYRHGDAERALHHLGLADGREEASQDLHARRSRLMLRAWLHLELEADFDAAEAYFREASRLGRRIHSPATVAFARYGLALCAYFRGRIVEAREEFDAFAADILAQGVPSYAIEGKWMVAECSLRLGDLERFDCVVAGLGDPSLKDGLDARPVHVRVMRGIESFLRGDREGCRVAFEDAIAAARRGLAAQDAGLEHFVRVFYAAVLRTIGEGSAAEEHSRRVGEFLEAYRQKARLAIFPALERELTQTLSRSGTHTPRQTG